MNPRPGQRWRSKTTGYVVRVVAIGPGMVTFEAAHGSHMSVSRSGFLHFFEPMTFWQRLASLFRRAP